MRLDADNALSEIVVLRIRLRLRQEIEPDHVSWRLAHDQNYFHHRRPDKKEHLRDVGNNNTTSSSILFFSIFLGPAAGNVT